MSASPELRAARRRWHEREDKEELSLLQLLMDEIPDSPMGHLQEHEERRLLPKLAMATIQVRVHSSALVWLTWALVGLTVALACLTVVQIGVALHLL